MIIHPRSFVAAIALLTLCLGLGSASLAKSSHHATHHSSYHAPLERDLANHNHYVNVDGKTVHSPSKTRSGGPPSGATAKCGDGSYSFSQHRQGTCSHHGGVGSWL